MGWVTADRHPPRLLDFKSRLTSHFTDKDMRASKGLPC